MDVLIEQDVADVEILTAGEVNGLLHARPYSAVRRADEAFQLKGARRGYGHVAGDVAAVYGDVARHLRRGRADGVPGHGAGDLRCSVVEKDQQRGRGGKVVIGIEDV